MDHRDLALSLVQDLLAAPGSQEGWHDFLLHLCQALDGSGSNFIAHDFASNEGTVALTARTAPEAVAIYQQHWHQFDPWAHHPAVGGMTVGTVLTGEQLITRHDMNRTPFYNDFGRQYDVFAWWDSSNCRPRLCRASP